MTKKLSAPFDKARPRTETLYAREVFASPDPAILNELVIKRVLAYGIDLIAILALQAALWVLAVPVGILSLGVLLPVVALVAVLLPLAYHSYLLSSPRSATLGMRVMGLEMRMEDGRRLDLGTALLVTALFYVSVALTSWLILIVCFFDDRRRLVHDMLCKTVVVPAPQVQYEQR